jgi:hypothetical protein
MIEPVTTHVKQGLARLLSKEKDSVNLRALLTSYLNRVQELEDTAWLVINSRTLDGEGAQLDLIGSFLVEPRGELDDDDYKIALRAKLRIMRSSGRPLDLQEVAALSLPEGFSHNYSEAYPKTAIVEVGGEVDFAVDVLWRNLLATKAGGTRLFLTWETTANAYRFAPADVEIDDLLGGDGDDDEDASPGGSLADAYGS